MIGCLRAMLCIYIFIGMIIGLATDIIANRMVVAIEMRAKHDNSILYRNRRREYIVRVIVGGTLYAFLELNSKGNIELLMNGSLVFILLIITKVDIYTYEIPLILNVCILILGLIRIGLDFKNISLYIIGFFAVSGFLNLLSWISGGSWIGGGDIRLMAAAGLFLGWKLILVAFVAGCVLGSMIHLAIMAMKKGEHKLAFGPYLSLGIYISMIWGEQLASWYLSLLRI